jgi:formyl-CoA transferase
MTGLAAMDIIAQAAGGVMHLTGPTDGDPVKVGAPIADFTASFLIVIAVLTGLYRRENTSQGASMATSLLGGQIALLPNVLAGFHVTGHPAGAYGSGHPQLVPYQAFHASDGLVVIGCLTEEHWRRLCRILSKPELIEDRRFLRNIDRVQHRVELVPLIEEVIGRAGRDSWVAELNAAGVPAGPVNRLEDVIASEQVAANGYVHSIGRLGPDDAEVMVVGNPIRIDGCELREPEVAPALGSHTAAVLAEFGFDAGEIDALT